MKAGRKNRRGKSQLHLPDGGKAPKGGIKFKIFFDFSPSMMDCFINETKPPCKPALGEAEEDLQWSRLTSSCDLSDNTPVATSMVVSPSRLIEQAKDEEFVQQAANTVLLEIENKGVSCEWGGEEDRLDSKEFILASQNCFNVQAKNEMSLNILNTKTCLPVCATDRPKTQFSYRYYDKRYSDDVVCKIVPELIIYDDRTTLLINKIPFSFTFQELAYVINEFAYCYNFLYLPTDETGRRNLGLAHINFISLEYLYYFYHRFQNVPWFNGKRSKYPCCSLTYSRIQGFDALVADLERGREKGYRYGKAFYSDQINFYIAQGTGYSQIYYG